MSKIDKKKDFNTCDEEKTLLKLNRLYVITLEKDVTPLCFKKGHFKKWDKIKIVNIERENWSIALTVTFDHYREEKIFEKNSRLGWWVFLSSFLSSINPDDIVVREVTNTIKDEVKEIVEKWHHDKKWHKHDKEEKEKKEKKWIKILDLFKKKKKKPKK